MRNRLVPACLGVLLAVGLAGAAVAERAEVLSSRGLVALHAGRYAEALGLFDRAVSADPTDVYARYYRGVTQGRLGNHAAAVADLQAVVAMQPVVEQAPLELGGALVESAQYRDAVPWLERAQAVPHLDGRASFLLGLAQLRLGEFEAADRSFARAAARDASLAASARYYQGVVAYRTQQYDQARDHFADVAGRSPDSDIGRAAAQFLNRLRFPTAEPQRPYTLYGEIGLQYDDNVQLLPLDEDIQVIGPSRRGDGRVILLGGGTYAPVRREAVELSLGYEFSQSVYFNLNEFNLQDHRPNAQLLVTLAPVRFGVFGMYDYYLRETDSYLSQGTVLPWLAIEGERAVTELFVRLRRSDFLERPENGVLDAWNIAPGLRESIYVDGTQRYVFAGYRFEREDTIHSEGDAFAFNANEFSVGVGWAFPYAIRSQLAYAFRHKWYESQSDYRRDDEHQLVFGTSKDLTRNLTLTLAYFGTFNDSNQAAFRYDRNVGSVSLGVRF